MNLEEIKLILFRIEQLWLGLIMLYLLYQYRANITAELLNIFLSHNKKNRNGLDFVSR
jgi:hypothetical protein